MNRFLRWSLQSEFHNKFMYDWGLIIHYLCNLWTNSIYGNEKKKIPPTLIDFHEKFLQTCLEFFQFSCFLSFILRLQKCWNLCDLNYYVGLLSIFRRFGVKYIRILETKQFLVRFMISIMTEDDDEYLYTILKGFEFSHKTAQCHNILNFRHANV